MPQGRPQLRGVVDLPAHDQTVGLLEQASRRRAHDERGHQVLEHRSRPRNQRGAMRDGRRGAAEPKPMLGGDVALGDRKKAGEPRLGSQQIVAIRIERAFRREKSDRQQLAAAVEQEAKFHRKRHRSRCAFDDREPRRQRSEPRPSDRARSWRCAVDRGQACFAQNSISAPLPSPRSIASAPAMSIIDLGIGGRGRPAASRVRRPKAAPVAQRAPPRRARRQAGAGSRFASGRRRAGGRIPRKLCR